MVQKQSEKEDLKIFGARFISCKGRNIKRKVKYEEKGV